MCVYLNILFLRPFKCFLWPRAPSGAALAGSYSWLWNCNLKLGCFSEDEQQLFYVFKVVYCCFNKPNDFQVCYYLRALELQQTVYVVYMEFFAIFIFYKTHLKLHPMKAYCGGLVNLAFTHSLELHCGNQLRNFALGDFHPRKTLWTLLKGAIV